MIITETTFFNLNKIDEFPCDEMILIRVFSLSCGSFKVFASTKILIPDFRSQLPGYQKIYFLWSGREFRFVKGSFNTEELRLPVILTSAFLNLTSGLWLLISANNTL